MGEKKEEPIRVTKHTKRQEAGRKGALARKAKRKALRKQQEQETVPKRDYVKLLFIGIIAVVIGGVYYNYPNQKPVPVQNENVRLPKVENNDEFWQ